MTDWRSILTERLDLRACDPADVDELFPIFTDPEGWWYDPDSRHRVPEVTELWLQRAASRWDLHGLSYWTVRDRETGEVIGAGGAQRQPSGAWNLSYRIATARTGHGLAAELATAGIGAANATDPSSPVIAWVAEHNTPSRRVAVKAGLVDRGARIDADGSTRLAYADRDLDDERFPFGAGRATGLIS